MTCVLYERECINCGECDFCDIHPDKVCNNCEKCIEIESDYKIIAIDEVQLSDD